jgi:hypothetical protein
MRAAEVSYSAGRDFRVRPEVQLHAGHVVDKPLLCFSLEAAGAGSSMALSDLPISV